jgi:hypothetical protein
MGGSGGLRSRLIVAFIAVTVATALITAGTAIIGMIVARQFCRNTSTTMNTRTNASISVWYTLLTDSSTNTVVSYTIR